MSKNRYGRIYHSDHRYINLRFKSLDARRVFEAKFNRYHAEHDHDGEPPRFKEATAAEIGNPDTNTIHDVDAVTIDGYATYEIEEYHEDDGLTRSYRYKPPTCCVAPLISINRKLVDSATLERHEMSAIFGNMSDEEYQSLLDSVSTTGFIDNVVRLYEGQILDGWNRYSAAKELNLLRKLRFKQWHEDEHRDGDPKAFVLGRNLDRRHYSAARRAQVFVAFNDRFGHGGDRKSDDESSRQNGDLKTREQLATEAGVSTRTIDRAVQVEKEGKSEAVIAGETTAGEVIKERDLKKAVKRKKQVLKNMWDTRIQAGRDYVNGNTELNEYFTLPELEKGFAENNTYCADIFQSGIKRLDTARSFADFQEHALGVDESGNANTDTQDLESELRAISTYASDIRNWQRPDWSPDTNWILPLIEAKKKAEAEQVEKDYPGVEVVDAKGVDPEPAEDTVKSLWEKIEPLISEWKSNRKDKGVGHASKTMLLSAAKRFLDIPKDAETDVSLLKQLLDILAEVHGPGYTFERYVKMQCDGASIWEETEETDADTQEEADLGTEIQRLRSEIKAYLTTWQQDNPGTEDATLFVLLDARFRLFHNGTHRGTGPFFAEELAPLLSLMKGNDLCLADKVREMLGTGSGISSVADAETDEPDEDTSLAEIDNLPAVKYFLETLSKQVETFTHQVDKDNFSCAIYDLFLSDGDVYLTERQQLAILIDVAHTLVNESESL